MKRITLLTTVVTLLGLGAATLATAASCVTPNAAQGCACGSASAPKTSAPSPQDAAIYAPN